MIENTLRQDRPIARPVRQVRWAWWIGVAMVLLVGGVAVMATGGWRFSEHSIRADRIRIATVERGTLVRDIAVDGRVTTANSPTLYAIAAGTVQLDVVAGDSVQKGQVLATIESPELMSRLAQNQASLALLESEVGRSELDVAQGRAEAQKRVDQAEIDRRRAAREVEGLQSAYNVGALAEIEYRRAQDDLKKEQIALQHAREYRRLEVQALSFDLNTKRLELKRQASVVEELKRQVDALVIRSPVDGQVGQVLLAQRANVSADTAVLTVVDLSAFELEVGVPDSFARDLGIGMPAEILVGGNGYVGRVRSIAPEVVRGEVAARIEFTGDKPEGLRQNQRLTARILLAEKHDVLMVERGPFLESGGGEVAYVVHQGTAERRPIRTGVSSLQAVELLSGVQPGDRLVVSGDDAFGGAQRVQLAGR